jgi:hypothetical protein
LRPIATEIVVALDERVDTRLLGPVSELCDQLVRYPYGEPVERPRAWMHSLAHGDWVFTIDDDEVPSPALLEALAAPDDALTHAWLPRRWLWEDGWLLDEPWAPDWQLRLMRPDAVRFPGVMHVPIRAAGPHAYLDAPLYHLDLLAVNRPDREEKARRYERVRPGLRFGGLPFNIAYYLPEMRDGLRIAPIPPADLALIDRVRHAPEIAPSEEPALRVATRDEVDEHWAAGPIPESAYAARIEFATSPRPVAGERRKIDVTVTNLGTETWPAGEAGLPEIRLGYRFEGREPGARTAFPHEVAPGRSTRVPLAFEAPDAAGTYTLLVDLVHERHRWFGCEARTEIRVEPRRRAVILVGRAPGDDAFDARVDEALERLDPWLEPMLIGPKPDWLRDRFGRDASSELPAWRPEQVVVLPSERRSNRLRLTLRAWRLRGYRRAATVSPGLP